MLAFTPRAAAREIDRVLASAVANAESAHGLDGDELVVLEAYADEGPTLKRWRARARGRVNRIRKRTCHITVVVAELPGERSPAAAEGGEARRRERRRRRRPRPPRRPPPRRSRSRSAARRRRRRKERPPDGPESASRRPSGRRHPRLEVELVDRQEGDRRLHPRGHPDPRPHQRQARARRPVGHPDPQGQAADHGRHLHGAAGDRDRQVGRRGGRAPQGAPLDHRQERPHQHQRDQAPRARRAARRAVDRGAASEPRVVPARDEALARLGDALGRAGDQDPVRRPARRRRDEPQRALHRGPRAAAHDPRRHRLRLRRGEDDLRPDRRQGVGQQGRDHARGLRGVARPRADLGGRRLAPSPRLEHRGPRRLPRERPRPRPGPRGPRASSRSAAAPAVADAAPRAAAGRRGSAARRPRRRRRPRTRRPRRRPGRRRRPRPRPETTPEGGES